MTNVECPTLTPDVVPICEPADASEIILGVEPIDDDCDAGGAIIDAIAGLIRNGNDARALYHPILRIVAGVEPDASDELVSLANRLGALLAIWDTRSRGDGKYAEAISTTCQELDHALADRLEGFDPNQSCSVCHVLSAIDVAASRAV